MASIASVTSTISNAQKAISVGNSLVGNNTQNPSAPPSKTSVWQSIHWSAYVVAIGALVALVTGVALAVIGQYPQAAVYGVLVATQLIGAFYIKELGPYKELGTIADQLADIVNKIFLNQKQIQISNKQMQQTTLDLQKTNDKTKSLLDAANATLKQQADAANKAKEQSDKTIKALQDSDAKLQTKIKDTEDKLTNMTKLYQSVQGQVVELKKNLDEYRSLQTKISNDTAELAKLATYSCETANTLLNRRATCIQQRDSFLQALQTKVTSLEKTVVSTKDSDDIQKAVTGLQNEGDVFEEQVKKFESAEAGLETTATSIHSSLEERKKQSDQLGDLLKFIKSKLPDSPPTNNKTISSNTTPVNKQNS